MSYDLTQGAHVTPGVKAAEDLRTHQHKAVRFDAGGIRLATATNVNSGPVFVLMNKPNSGEQATLGTGPSIVKALAGAAISLGTWVTLGTSADFIQGSFTTIGSTQIVGVAFEAPTAVGQVFALQLR